MVTVNRILPRHELFKNRPVKFSTLDNIGLGAGKISPHYFRRLYKDPILGNIWLYAIPKIDMMKRDMPVYLSAFVEGEIISKRFHVDITKSNENIDNTRYFAIFLEPIGVVSSVYENVSQLVPPLGIERQVPWIGLLESIPDFNLIGQEFHRVLGSRKDRQKFSADSIEKASILLHKIAGIHGFNVYSDRIEKGCIVINRQDCSFWINGSFRCLTSNYNTPKDDQVIQKLLALTNPKSLDSISTLNGNDKKSILQEMLNI